MDSMGSLVAFFLTVVGLMVWLLPILFIGMSERTDGREKTAWILAVMFISWFAWVFYCLLAPLRQQREMAQ